VVALKRLTFAKSRLATLPAPLRRRLAWCMAYDTIAALTDAVEQVVVVSDQPALQARLRPLGPRVWVLPEVPGGGLNAALRYGAAELSRRAVARRAPTRPESGMVVACVGDLPALRPTDVQHALHAAAQHSRSYLADYSGIGTTMLFAQATDLDPHFGGRSAAAHKRSGAVALDDGSLPYPIAGARRDVDTEVDLADAVRIGVGDATQNLFEPLSGRLGDYSVITTTSVSGPGSRVVITSRGTRAELTDAALSHPLRGVREGQRLHAVLAGDRVLSAWL
jgi:2-phospho-L-lactate guanylyltransferase